MARHSFPYVAAVVLLAVLPVISYGQNASQIRDEKIHWSIGTNVVDWIDFGTMNLNASVSASRYITVETDIKYNPWTFNGRIPAKATWDKKFSASAGCRFWPWYVYSGWWLGARLKYEMYSRANFLYCKKTEDGWMTEEGHAYGMGISAGYSFMVNKNFNIDVGAGLWAGPTRYTTYGCPVCGGIAGSGRKFFLLPDNVMVSFVYVF